jgi:hypothetical protein
VDNTDEKTMLALTVVQPYAWAIINGYKTVEWRNSKTRQDTFALHAGKTCDSALQGRMQRLSPHLEGWPEWPKYSELVLGAVLGVIRITGIYDVKVDHLPISDFDYRLGYADYWRYGWKLEVLEVFGRPVPARGMPGFWAWSR